MKLTKKSIIKNLLVLSFSFLASFTAVMGLKVIQSTLNDKTGVVCMAVEFACGCLASLVFPKYLIRKFGSKTVLVASLIGNIPFVVANFYPHFIVMLPTSIIIGFTSTLLWNSLNTYLNDASVLYAQLIISSDNVTDDILSKLHHGETNPSVTSNYNSINESSANYTDINYSDQNNEVNLEKFNAQEPSLKKFEANSIQKQKYKVLETTTARFFGFFGFVCQFSMILSGTIAYFILESPLNSNSIEYVNCACGADYCGTESNCFETNLQLPKNETRYTLISVHLGISFLSVLMCALYLDNLNSSYSKVTFSCNMALSTIKFQSNLNQLLLIPLTLYIGMHQAFLVADFTKSFVGCAWGIRNVSITAIFYGFAASIASALFGTLEKKLGRRLIFIFTTVLNLLSCATMLIWRPDGNHPEMIIAVVVVGGTVEGILWSGLRAFIGIIFKEDEEVAYGSYQLWHALGSAISYSYSSYICTFLKIYVLLGVSTIGLVGYLVVENNHLAHKTIVINK